jgi:hypothetical protein
MYAMHIAHKQNLVHTQNAGTHSYVQALYYGTMAHKVSLVDRIDKKFREETRLKILCMVWHGHVGGVIYFCTR